MYYFMGYAAAGFLLQGILKSEQKETRLVPAPALLSPCSEAHLAPEDSLSPHDSNTMGVTVDIITQGEGPLAVAVRAVPQHSLTFQLDPIISWR